MRQTEAMERLKIEAEHNGRINRLMAELERVREELDIRVRVIGAEMVRWRAQAEAAAAAVRDAKDEVRALPPDLCCCVASDALSACSSWTESVSWMSRRNAWMAWLKSSMLVCCRCGAVHAGVVLTAQRLRTGREKGLELRGAIDSHLERYGHAPVAAPAASPAEHSGAEQAPSPPSSAASKTDPSARPSKTPPGPSTQQAKPRKQTPETSTGRGYADLSRAGKARTPG